MFGGVPVIVRQVSGDKHTVLQMIIERYSHLNFGTG